MTMRCPAPSLGEVDRPHKTCVNLLLVYLHQCSRGRPAFRPGAWIRVQQREGTGGRGRRRMEHDGRRSRKGVPRPGGF